MLIIGLLFAGERRWEGHCNRQLGDCCSPWLAAAPRLSCSAYPPSAGMYVFIKMTRLAGYRATVPVPAPVPAASVPLPPPQDPPGADVPVYEQHYEL